MSLSEKKIIDVIEVIGSHLQVREANIIEKDGVEITRTFVRKIVSPGDDLSGEDPKVVAIANALWGLGQ